MVNPTEKDLTLYFKRNVIKDHKKIKGKHAPIAEIVENMPRSFPIDSIYNINEIYKNFYLLVVKNYLKKPKFKYLLAVSIANNSSDLLVQLARNSAIKYGLRLIQYSIYPKTLRIHLLSLKEIKNPSDYKSSVEVLKAIRKEVRDKLVRLEKLVEDE